MHIRHTNLIIALGLPGKISRLVRHQSHIIHIYKLDKKGSGSYKDQIFNDTKSYFQDKSKFYIHEGYEKRRDAKNVLEYIYMYLRKYIHKNWISFAWVKPWKPYPYPAKKASCENANQRQTNWIFPTRNVFLTLYFVEFGKQEMYSVFFVVVREMVLFKWIQ